MNYDDAKTHAMTKLYDNTTAADLADFFNGTDTIPKVSVIVEHDVLIQADGYDVGVATLGTTISAQVTDVGTPSRGNTFLVDGTTYTVQRIEENDNVAVKVVVK